MCVSIDVVPLNQSISINCAKKKYKFSFVPNGRTLKFNIDGLEYIIVSYEKYKHLVLELCVNYAGHLKRALWIFIGQKPMEVERSMIMRDRVDLMEEMYQIETFSYIKRGQLYRKHCNCIDFDKKFIRKKELQLYNGTLEGIIGVVSFCLLGVLLLLYIACHAEMIFGRRRNLVEWWHTKRQSEIGRRTVW